MINWPQIDTVLLDMDGTLLDLHYDNHFWCEHLPKRYAAIHQTDEQAARTHIEAFIKQHEGTLNWYCLDYWSNAMQLDIMELKHETQHKIQLRPYVEEFLNGLRQQGKRVVLVTNAHPKGLQLKLEVTRIDHWLDVVVSSHEFAAPKEEQQFWQKLHLQEPFNPARTLFIDDTARILESARLFGIEHLLGIHQPDSQKPRTLEGFPAIHSFADVLPIAASTQQATG